MNARLHAVKDAPASSRRTQEPLTAQATPPDVALEARVTTASILTRALDRVSHKWLAAQIGRSLGAVGRWFRRDEAERHPAPLALLITRRADGRGYVLDDAEFERVVAELRRERSL